MLTELMLGPLSIVHEFTKNPGVNPPGFFHLDC